MSEAELAESRARAAKRRNAAKQPAAAASQLPDPNAAALNAATQQFSNLSVGNNTVPTPQPPQPQKAAAAATSTFTPQSGSLVYRFDTIDKDALAAQITALGGKIPSTAGRAKVVVASAPPPQRTPEEIKAHLDRKFKAIQAAYKAAAPKTDEELKAEIMAVIRKVEKNAMSIQDVKAYAKQRDVARYLRKDKFTDAMLATRIQKRVDEDEED